MLMDRPALNYQNLVDELGGETYRCLQLANMGGSTSHFEDVCSALEQLGKSVGYVRGRDASDGATTIENWTVEERIQYRSGRRGI